MYSKYEPPKHAIPKLDREKMNLSELDKLKNLETCYGPHWEDAIDRNFFTANSSLKFPSSTRSSHACSTKTKLLLAKRHAKRRCLFAAQQNESNLKFHALMKKENRYKGKNLSQISNCWSLLNGIDEYVTERREISRSKFPSLGNIDKQSQNSKYRVSLRSVSPNSINPSFIKNWEFPETIDKEKEIVEEDEVNLKTTPKFVPNLTSKKANKSVNIVFGNHPNDLSDIPRKSQAGSPTDRSHENIITGEDFSPDLNENLLRSIPKININTKGGPLSFKKFRKMKNIYNKLAMDKLDLNTGRKSKKLAEYILGGMERQPENKSILNNPETAYSLGPKVLKSKAIRKLDLETSKLSQKGIDSLCKYLKWNKNLNSLNLARNSINNEALQYILDVLEDNNNIETLDLSMNRIIETTYIKNLTLKDNNFGRKGAFKIAQILLTETSKNILERVDFSCIKSDAEGTAKILECLAKGHTIKSFTYDRNRINNCNLSNDGACSIGAGIIKNSSLKTLLLRSNFIGDVGAISIAQGIGSSKATLEKLDLSSNEITDRGGKEIIKSISENISLLHLNLRANYLEEVGVSFVKLTKEKNNLLTVDLNLNSIRQSNFYLTL